MQNVIDVNSGPYHVVSIEHSLPSWRKGYTRIKISQ